MKPSGIHLDTQLVEMIELDDHPWFLGCQFHPEYKSKPMQPHPLFKQFIRAAREFAKRQEWTQQRAEETSQPKKEKRKIVKS